MGLAWCSALTHMLFINLYNNLMKEYSYHFHLTNEEILLRGQITCSRTHTCKHCDINADHLRQNLNAYLVYSAFLCFRDELGAVLLSISRYQNLY